MQPDSSAAPRSNDRPTNAVSPPVHCRQTVSPVHPGWWRTEWLDADGKSLGVISYRRRRAVRRLPRVSWWLAIASQVSLVLNRLGGSLAWRSSAN